MYKVAGVAAVPGTLWLLSGTVFAATKDNPNVTLNTDELSLYTIPQQKFRYVEPEIGHLEQGVTTLRKLAEPYTTWCQGAVGKVMPKVESAIQLGNETFTFLQNPPAEFYPRAGVIGFAGILGLFLARGSRVKKLIYPTGLMAVGYTMYYPQQAASIAKNTGDSLYDFALQGYVNVEKVFKSVEGKPVKKEKPQENKPEETR
ncbi:apolipoprotein O, a isoform 2-T2 [Salvelinus alpinus]|uniref:apolipoprotein O, a isoform X2 n=1 Tax=Salvelinus sp. IW2-2015 TaxID=2691554 RepID=UPI000CDF82EB|nr:MICOS complex subunit MIC26 isoform X2 [Salvelinus alpinus]XP_055799420.1 apolipoprotein O, a isoform X2 [Salvelinus fontinalis]